MAYLDKDAPMREDAAHAIKHYCHFARMAELSRLIFKHPHIWRAVREGRLDIFYGSVNAPDTPDDERVAEVVDNLFFTYKGITTGPFPFGEDKDNGMTTTALDSFVELLEKILEEEDAARGK